MKDTRNDSILCTVIATSYESKIVPSRYSLSPHSGVLGRSFELRFTYTMFPLQSHNEREKKVKVLVA